MAARLKKISPVLPVDEIDPSIPFFLDAGFEQTASVPGPDGNMGFVILELDCLEIMLQSLASIADDVVEFAELAEGSIQFLFVEVESIDDLESALTDYEPVMPRRSTFYGATEIGYREPGGHVIVFAEMGEPTAEA